MILLTGGFLLQKGREVSGTHKNPALHALGVGCGKVRKVFVKID